MLGYLDLTFWSNPVNCSLSHLKFIYLIWVLAGIWHKKIPLLYSLGFKTTIYHSIRKDKEHCLVPFYLCTQALNHHMNATFAFTPVWGAWNGIELVMVRLFYSHGFEHNIALTPIHTLLLRLFLFLGTREVVGSIFVTFSWFWKKRCCKIGPQIFCSGFSDCDPKNLHHGVILRYYTRKLWCGRNMSYTSDSTMWDSNTEIKCNGTLHVHWIS